MRVKFGDVVNDIKINVDRNDCPHEYYIAGEHMDTEELHITRRGKLADGLTGSAFTRLFKAGQVLYGSRRTYLKKCSVVDFDGICANTTFVLESKDNSIFLHDLLPFLILSDRFTEYSIKKSRGSVNPYVLFKDIADFEFDLPNMDEQRRLAEVLWAFDGVKQAYKRLIAATDELVKCQFVEMFGDPVTNPLGWDISTIKEIATDGLSYGSGASAIDYDNEIRYVRITDITDNGELNNNLVSPSQYDEKYLLRDGDILFARSGATVGKTFQYRKKWGKCIYAGYLIKLIPNTQKVLSDYVFGYTKTDYYQEFVKLNQRTVAQPNINAQQYGDLTICVPPLSLQHRFADFVRQSDKSKFELQQSLYELEATYKALLRERLG